MSVLVKELSRHCVDEVEGALEYARLSMEMADRGDRKRAEMFADMAEQEYNHAQEIHGLLVTEIEEASKNAERLGIRPPDAMTRRYGELHSEYVEKASAAKEYLDTCRRLASA